MNKKLESYIKNELPKESDDYKKILMLYSLGLTSAEEIYEYTKIEPIDTIKRTIYKIEKEGNYTDLVLEEIIDLYNNGVIDIQEIVDITGEKRRIVIDCLQRAVISGRIVAKSVPTENYARVIELAKQNKNDEQIQQETGLTYNIVAKYLNKAVKEGHIDRRNNDVCGKLKQIVDLTIQGKDEDFITKYLNISQSTYHKYYKMAINRGLIPKKNLKKQKEEKSIEDKIFDCFKTLTYTIEVARKLRLEPHAVFEIIENLSDDKKKELLNIRLSSNPLYSQVKKQAEVKKCDLEDVLDEMSLDTDYNRLFLVSRLYYVLGNYQKALKMSYRILNIKKNEHGIKDTILLERRKMKVDMIRRDYLENQTSTSMLCKIYEFDKEIIESITNVREKNIDYEL